VSPATVVTIYLLPEVNLMVRPKLLSTLKPGTRVVSHDFDMGEWAPERTYRVRGPDRQHRLYFWLIPARVAGAWHSRIGDGEGATLALTQDFQNLTGTLLTGALPAAVVPPPVGAACERASAALILSPSSRRWSALSLRTREADPAALPADCAIAARPALAGSRARTCAVARGHSCHAAIAATTTTMTATPIFFIGSSRSRARRASFRRWATRRR